MSDEVATLKDATPGATDPVDTPVDPQAEPTTATATTSTEVADPDAAEMGRILLESGVAKNQINDLLAAPRALAALRHAVVNDPQEFQRMLERTDPTAADQFMSKISDLYLERNQHLLKTPKEGGAKEGDSDLMRQVGALSEKITRYETEQSRRDQAAAMAQVKNRFEGRVDDLFGQLPKEMGLTKTEKRGIRAVLETELAADPSAVQRITNGNFVDVPKTFKGIIESWTSDKKAAAEAAKTDREQVSSGSFGEFSSGPNPFMNLPKDEGDDWESTAVAMGKAFGRFRE